MSQRNAQLFELVVSGRRNNSVAARAPLLRGRRLGSPLNDVDDDNTVSDIKIFFRLFSVGRAGIGGALGVEGIEIARQRRACFGGGRLD